MSKKSEKRGEERKGKVKVKTAVSLLNPKIVKILLSVHAQTSQADILHHQSDRTRVCKDVAQQNHKILQMFVHAPHHTKFAGLHLD